MSDTPAELGEYAQRLALGAADLIRRALAETSDSARSDGLDVHTKSTSTDLVTVVDRASETWLVERLGEDRPDDAILGEEGGGRGGSSGVRWLLDPIDGTVNFVLGLPEFAVSVAAEVDGEMVAGAVCAPISGELFAASRGGGAWLSGRRLRGPRTVDLERAVIGTGFSYDRDRRRRQGRVVAELLPRVGDVRRIGSAALDLCSVAAGRLDGYYEAALNPWDVAAGGLIAEEAGVVVSGLRGSAASAHTVVAAGPGLAPALTELLERLGAHNI